MIYIVFKNAICWAIALIISWHLIINISLVGSGRMRRQTSISEVLPTIKRLCVEEQSLAYSQGKTYQQNGLVLKHKLTNLRIKSLVSTFARKLKRNLTTAKPVYFQIKSPEEENESRIVHWTGWDIEDRFEGMMMLLDILMTLLVFFISAFHGFLEDYRRADSSSTPILVLKIVALVIFGIRMVMSFVTIDYEDDTFYLYITDIIRKQLKRASIVINIFVITMIVISISMPHNEAVGIVFFFSAMLRMMVIRSNFRMLEILFIDSIKKFYLWNLIRVIIFNIIFAHTIATALLAISRINPEKSWIILKLVNNDFVDEGQTWFQVYIWSYYWACTIMMTVGFGDISPVDYRESIVVAFIEIFSSIVLAYNISEVGSIVSSMRKSSQELERKLGVLRRMLRKNPIPQQLSFKIQSYLSHQIQIKDKYEYSEHRQIIQNLPQQLKQEYFAQQNNDLYASIPVLRYFQKQCRAKLNKAFHGKVYYPGQFIIKYKEGCGKLIIMRSGKFGLSYWKPKSVLNGSIVQSICMEDNQTTGLLITTNVLTKGDSLNYDIVAQRYSYGLQLQLEDFLTILKETSMDYYFYRSVLDRHEKMPNTYDYVECEYCQEYHTKFECTRLHYIPIKGEVILRSRSSPSKPAARREKYRKNRLYKHAYLLRKMFFQLLEKALNVSREDIPMEDELDSDQPYDFSMYFKDSNPDALKGKKFPKSKALQKLGTIILSGLSPKK